MKLKSIFAICLLLSASFSYAQWEVGLGGGVAIPITGYKEIVKTGWLLSAEGKYRFKSNFAVGMKTQFARLQKDKDPNDAFQQARMTIAPVIFIAEYAWTKSTLQPYLTGGLGITFFNINYETAPTQGTSINNVSFTMMPLVGLRYPASNNVFIFLESGMQLIADGPPIGFPKGEKMTGYGFISTGIHYRF